MKICIPVEKSNGLLSPLFGHFGSAPFFLIYDHKNNSHRIIPNTHAAHTHGMCQPLKMLAGEHLDAVVCRGMGARAVQKLNQGGLKAYLAEGQLAVDVLDAWTKNQLPEITPQTACQDHACY